MRPRAIMPGTFAVFAIIVTVLHFVIVLAFNPLSRRLTARLAGSVRLRVTYEPDRSVLTRILAACDKHQWSLTELNNDPDGGVLMTLSGTQILRAPTTVAAIAGVTGVRRLDEKDE
jgi:putative Mg2+ transporter-C (MgtC) family protein